MSCVSGGTVSATSPTSSTAMAARHVRSIDPQEVRASAGSMNQAPASGASIGLGAKTPDVPDNRHCLLIGMSGHGDGRLVLMNCTADAVWAVPLGVTIDWRKPAEVALGPWARR
jgi:hypothetical protein